MVRIQVSRLLFATFSASLLLNAYFSTKYKKLSFDDSNKKILLAGILGLAGILFASLFQCYYPDLETNLLWWFIISSGVVIFAKK